MGEMTPMMRQYLEIKEKHKDYILFFRLGDFYEMFFDDAKLVSKELELTLTGRDCGLEERAPMCGVPYHSCESYIARLIAKGYKVAICEQTEDPALAKGLVKRDIVRIITPGTVTDQSMLDEVKNNFIASAYADQYGMGVCFADVSTGELFATESREDTSARMQNELGKFAPAELVICPFLLEDQGLKRFLKDRLLCAVTPYDKSLTQEEAERRVQEHFGKSGEKLGLTEKPYALIACGMLLCYLHETQFSSLAHISSLNLYSQAQHMELDLFTRRNLELSETMRTKEKRGSLLWVLDKTKTAMGGRLLRGWIERPLNNCAAIGRRLSAVDELKSAFVARQEMAAVLSGIFDMERLMAKVVYATANGRDLRALTETLRKLPDLKKAMAGFTSPLLSQCRDGIDEMSDLFSLLDGALAEDPPFTVREGGLIKDGYSPEVDELRSILEGGHGIIAKLEQSQREKTGIKNLKIGYNKVFGYYIEVTRSYLDLVPETYIRKQTLANCERFITEELKELESRILGAQDRVVRLEYELFCALRDTVAENLHRIQSTAQSIANIDALCSFAEVADKNNYVRPEVDYSDELIIKDGRHPVVERLCEGLFVPNDTTLDCRDNRLVIITGPNMAGKSTYMRQVALIALMAQAGSFVPASYARIGVVDRIFTRVGASDDLATGQSTFMVEMSEVAAILKNATAKSLLIFDEIGRGTSTFDGMSIARAVLEYVADKRHIGARTLFATHYHELTELEGVTEGVKNYNTAVKKRGDDITFLRKIVRGAADESYGIEVAKLAGVPEIVIRRAKEVQKHLDEGEKPCPVGARRREKRAQDENATFASSLLDSGYVRLAEELCGIDVDVLTPLEAMNLLFEFVKKARGLSS